MRDFTAAIFFSTASEVNLRAERAGRLHLKLVALCVSAKKFAVVVLSIEVTVAYKSFQASKPATEAAPVLKKLRRVVME